MKKQWFTVNMDAPTPEVMVNGYIGAEDKVNYADFKTVIDQIKAAGHKRAIIKLNTGGGEMFEGFAIYDYAAQSGVLFDVQIVGVAASMGSVLMLIAQELPDISEHGRIMLHNPKALVLGEAESMEETAKVMKDLRSDVIDVLVKKTGADKATVESWFVRGKDTWFTAKEAKKAGLVRNIIKGTPAPKQEPPKNATERDVWQVYNTVIVTNQTTDMLSVTMLAKLGLPKDATAADVEVKINTLLEEKETQITNLTQKVTDLEKTINDAAAAATAALKAKGEAFFNKLVEAKKITADKKDNFIKNYLNDAASVEELFGSVETKEVKISNNDTGGSDERDKWSYADWMKKDSKGLEKMAVENKAKFDKLLAEYVGQQ